MDELFSKKISQSLERFVNWLEGYGETSYDHQTYFAGPIGGKAKALYYKSPLLGTLAVAPMIFSEAFVPSGRKLFWKRQRLPIADAHYAMGFAHLSQVYDRKEFYDKAVHFLNILDQTKCPGYKYSGWGYPFHWTTRNGVIKMGTALITTTPYVYDAYLAIYQIDKSEKWLTAMHSIAEHAAQEYKDFEVAPGACSCAYTPDPNDMGGVVNASAYRACLLTSASQQLSNRSYWEIAERNVNFVLQSQQPNGSWLYSIDSVRDFVDHFHTCFVLKALARIDIMTGHEGCRKAIERGIAYYLNNLFDNDGLPKPFAKAPRLTVYKNEMYDYAECINLCALLRNRFSELDQTLITVVEDVLSRWQKRDGSYRARKLFLGWDNVPMHRWAESQIFRSLALLLQQEATNAKQKKRE